MAVGPDYHWRYLRPLGDLSMEVNEMLVDSLVKAVTTVFVRIEMFY